MKIGDTFSKLEYFEAQLGDSFPKKGFLTGSFIPSLTKNPNLSCARLVFYNDEFLNFAIKKPKDWWDEFEGITKSSARMQWTSQSWIKSLATATVHEIFSPIVNSQKPGADSNGLYHPNSIIIDQKEKRIILGQFHGRPNYIFLGCYQLDQQASLNQSMSYKVDSQSFPLKQSNLSAPIITYPHCIWRRIEENEDEALYKSL